MANKAKRLEIEAAQAARVSRFQDLLRTKCMQKTPKRRTPQALYSELNASRFASKIVRPLETYVTKCYNLQRQKESFIKHLFVKYPVPKFMFQIFESQEAREYQFDWFFCLAQGGSFQKMVKNIMTKKEVISFLKTPENYSFPQAFWYAKMNYRGVPDKVIYDLLFHKNIFNGLDPLNYEQYHERYEALMDFYVKYYDEMDQRAFDEISDFVQFRMRNDQTFTLRGRTLNSVTELSNEWHTLTQKASLGAKVEWLPIQKKIWYHEIEKHNSLWEIRELTSNHALINEGRKQKHCVGSYTNACSTGSCNIFSMRHYYFDTLTEQIKNRITIEKRNSSLVQVRGLMNRRPNDMEEKIVRKWATEMGYTYEPPKYRWF